MPIRSLPRRSFAGLESGEQLAQTPLAQLQFRLRLAHLFTRAVENPHDPDYEQDYEPAAAR